MLAGLLKILAAIPEIMKTFNRVTQWVNSQIAAYKATQAVNKAKALKDTSDVDKLFSGDH